MTPRAQELFDLLKAKRAAEPQASQEISTPIRERIIVEKFDHEIGDQPVLVETVDIIVEHGVMTHHVTVHEPPRQTQEDSSHASS